MSRSAHDRQAGMVTAETAVVLPVLFLVLGAAVFALVCVGAQLRCVDVARDAARAAARGEASGAVTAAARAALPGSLVTLQRDGESVSVQVRREVRPLGGLLAGLPGVPVGSRATAHVEPGLSS